MEITVSIPDEFARRIIPEGLDPSRQALEDMAVEAYRAHFRRAAPSCFGHPLRLRARRFSKGTWCGVWLEYTLEDFRPDEEISAPLLM